MGAVFPSLAYVFSGRVTICISRTLVGSLRGLPAPWSRSVPRHTVSLLGSAPAHDRKAVSAGCQPPGYAVFRGTLLACWGAPQLATRAVFPGTLQPTEEAPRHAHPSTPAPHSVFPGTLNKPTKGAPRLHTLPPPTPEEKTRVAPHPFQKIRVSLLVETPQGRCSLTRLAPPPTRTRGWRPRGAIRVVAAEAARRPAFPR